MLSSSKSSWFLFPVLSPSWCVIIDKSFHLCASVSFPILKIGIKHTQLPRINIMKQSEIFSWKEYVIRCSPCLLRKHLSLSLEYSSEALGRRTLGTVCDLAQIGWVWCELLLQLSPGAALLLQHPLYEASSRKCCLVDLAKRWTEPCGAPSWLLSSLNRSHGMVSISSEKFWWNLVCAHTWGLQLQGQTQRCLRTQEHIGGRKDYWS